MPPKRKGGAAKGAGGKKAKVEPEPATAKDALSKNLKTADSGKKKTHKVDQHFPYPGCDVYEDYDCMLNQTNIGHNNNKYYVIQVLSDGKQYFAWNRWGRVGESGANAVKSYTNVNQAIKDFTKKFQDKTKNKWENKDKFSPVTGKYTMLDMAGEDDDEEDEPAATASPAKPSGKTGKCSLTPKLQELLKFVLSADMFKDALKSFDIDVKKMPLGKLSKGQIAKGYECLEEIEESINSGKKNNAKLTELSSKFYTLIPHDFGRQRPPIMSSMAEVQAKYDMLCVLGDIEIAQSMEKEKTAKTSKGASAHPLDIDYNLLACDLEYIDPKSKEFKILEKYNNSTQGYRKAQIIDIFKVNRHSEGPRFKAVDKLGNRKLLWHGTNVAVVAAILKTGLRIMPHSGGRVGSGIYFASENGKSSGYVRPDSKQVGVMFLNEVALGKEKTITRDNCSLKAAPAGFDSVVARGWTEPDPKLDTELKLEGKGVVVPQGKPVTQSEYDRKSSFDQSEYLIYRENQCRIRYLLKMKFSY